MLFSESQCGYNRCWLQPLSLFVSVDKPVGKADSDCAEQHGQHEAQSPTKKKDKEPSRAKKRKTGKLSVCMW